MDCFPARVHLTSQNVATSNWQILKTAPQLIKQKQWTSQEGGGYVYRHIWMYMLTFNLFLMHGVK